VFIRVFFFSGAWLGGFSYYKRSSRGSALTGHQMARTKALIADPDLKQYLDERMLHVKHELI
jgi:hypothetical protein